MVFEGADCGSFASGGILGGALYEDDCHGKLVLSEGNWRMRSVSTPDFGVAKGTCDVDCSFGLDGCVATVPRGVGDDEPARFRQMRSGSIGGSTSIGG